MSNHSVKTTYRSMPATRLMRDRPVDGFSEGSNHRFGFIRLAATQWHRAATLLIDWDRAINEGWPSLRSPSCPKAKWDWGLERHHPTTFRRLAGNRK
ncbi:hypothetical protein [Cupriavidus sp. USMAA2-4]|uniref:hypothetical protein n=1 Tax=Cupriavidus sp. USMAA2-4 TaxID=876364 RepID=UPI0012F4BDA5|nr:hypothetical protein [Cupriavidus sp. USMAA2-4]